MDRRSETSAENGKKGGRPVSSATLRAQEGRRIMAEMLENDLNDIYEALREKAMKGDVAAINTLFDRAWGKPTQAVVTEDKDGVQQPITGFNYTLPNDSDNNTN